MPPKEVRWNDAWLKLFDNNEDVIGQWAKSEGNGKASCKWCSGKIFAVKSGITTLISHSKSEGHKTVSKIRKKNTTITSSFQTTQQQSVDSNSVLARKAEIRWVVQIVEKNYSFESQKDVVEVFKIIFEDSKIPAQMRLHQDKIVYTLVDAIFPFVQGVVLDEIKQASNFTLYIDEANKLKSYLAIVIRYFVKDSWNLKTVCIDLPTLTSADAKSIADRITKSMEKLNIEPEKCLSVMSDSCNVMRGK